MGRPTEKMQVQQRVLDTAYMQVKPVQTNEVIHQIKKPDWIDNGYVWLRTFIPSWLMLLIFVVGVGTVITYKFKKQIRQYLLDVLKAV